jgi:hypothetical protein
VLLNVDGDDALYFCVYFLEGDGSYLALLALFWGEDLIGLGKARNWLLHFIIKYYIRLHKGEGGRGWGLARNRKMANLKQKEGKFYKNFLEGKVDVSFWLCCGVMLNNINITLPFHDAKVTLPA